MAASVILIEDGLQIVANIVAAIQAARVSGSTTIDASVLSADVDARNAAQTQLDKDIASS